MTDGVEFKAENNVIVRFTGIGLLQIKSRDKSVGQITAVLSYKQMEMLRDSLNNKIPNQQKDVE